MAGVPVRIPEPVIRFRSSSVPEDYFPWGLELLGVHVMWSKGFKGEGVTVAVLDTGVDDRHPELKGRVVSGKSFVGYTNDYRDDHYHGTHVAATVAGNGVQVPGVAPKAGILAGKVLDADGSGLSEWIAAGIRWAVDAGADIINLSLGAPEPDPEIHDAIREAVARGVPVFAAAGNNGDANVRTDEINYPAGHPEVCSVSAVNFQQDLAQFSATGKVDLSGPGVEVYSAMPGGQYAFLSGTSMATPYVAGSAALILNEVRVKLGRRWSPDQLLQYMYLEAHDLGQAGYDKGYGYGLFTFNNAANCPLQGSA